jgi:hypothetical protein
VSERSLGEATVAPFVFLEKFSEKVLTEQIEVDVVDIFPSWEDAL